MQQTGREEKGEGGGILRQEEGSEETTVASHKEREGGRQGEEAIGAIRLLRRATLSTLAGGWLGISVCGKRRRAMVRF